MGEQFDYIVVGSGSAGAVISARLSENPNISVLLLEAGPPDDDDMIRLPAGFASLFKTQWDWGYTSTPQAMLGGRRADWPRMKALGGCSAMNAMIYMRGNPADYDAWRDDYRADGWGYSDVLPYFKKSEANQRLADNYHGTDGPVRVEDRRYTHELSHAFVDAAVAAGMKRNDDFNGADQYGAGLYQVTCKNGRRWSVADAYLRPAMHRPNLTVRTGAFVTGLEVSGSRARGVTYRSGGQTITVHAGSEVIVAAGAINSPQLLMLSGLGPGQHLSDHGIAVTADLPGVGQGLQDHPVSPVLFYTRGTTDIYELQTPANLLRAQLFGRGPLSSNIAEAGAFFDSGTGASNDQAPDLQFHMLPAGFWDNSLHEPHRRAMLIASTLVNVGSRGRLRLRSADPTWQPEIDPGYFTDDADTEAMIAGYYRAIEVAASDPLRRYIDTPWMPGSWRPSRDDIRDTIAYAAQTIYHPVATCAMGTGPESVVDERLRVHGIDGLRVADASVMPQVPRGNTNAPTIMIGEKAVDLIMEDS